MSRRNPTLATAQLVRLDAYASTDEAATFAASQRADGRGVATAHESIEVASEWEAARQRNATERGYAYVAPTSTHDREQSSSLQPDTDCLRTDGELARWAFGLKQSPLLQRWIPLHDLARDTGRQGFTYTEYLDILKRHNIKGCDTYHLELLRRGHGLYWQIHNGMVYPAGYVTLCNRLAIHTHAFGLDDLYITNGVGRTRDMYINVSGSVADFEASILNAWIASKNNPTLSREVMVRLFNRDSRTLRRIEKRAGITVVRNDAETTDPADVPLNPDGSLRSDVWRTVENGRTVWHYRLPNTYISNPCKQHYKRGQSRRAAYSFKLWIESIQLPGTNPAGAYRTGKLKPTARLYCENEQVAKRSRRYGNTGVLYVPDKPGWGSDIVWSIYRD